VSYPATTSTPNSSMITFTLKPRFDPQLMVLRRRPSSLPDVHLTCFEPVTIDEMVAAV